MGSCDAEIVGISSDGFRGEGWGGGLSMISIRLFSNASSYCTVDGEKSTMGDVSSGSSRGVRGALPIIVSWLLMLSSSRL